MKKKRKNFKRYLKYICTKPDFTWSQIYIPKINRNYIQHSYCGTPCFYSGNPFPRSSSYFEQILNFSTWIPCEYPLEVWIESITFLKREYEKFFELAFFHQLDHIYIKSKIFYYIIVKICDIPKEYKEMILKGLIKRGFKLIPELGKVECYGLKIDQKETPLAL